MTSNPQRRTGISDITFGVFWGMILYTLAMIVLGIVLVMALAVLGIRP